MAELILERRAFGPDRAKSPFGKGSVFGRREPVPAPGQRTRVRGKAPVQDAEPPVADVPSVDHAAADVPFGSTVSSAPAVDMADVRYAGFWIRVSANALDTVIFAAAYAAVFVLIELAFPGEIHRAMNTGIASPDGVVLFSRLDMFSWSMGVLVYALFLSSGWQGTPGKRIHGIRVVTTDGEAVTFWRAFGRYFANIASLLPLAVGYMMAGWTREKTALHDVICTTRVIHGRT